MKVYVQAPMPELSRFVRRFLVVEFASSCHDQHLPDTSAVAAFSFQGECRLANRALVPPSAFTGLWETLRAHEHSAGHSVLLAAFTPLGAWSFLHQPLEEFSGATTDLSGILDQPGELGRLHENISDAADHGSRVKLLEGFLLARIRHFIPDPLVAAAVAWLEKGSGLPRIDALTQYIGLSQSALERRFRRVIGLTPKKYASLLRFRRAMSLCETGRDLTAVAHDAGYFDQSHFINDFRRITGSSPATYFRQAAAI
jgi:AraC-like DNA-binding protein